MLQRYRTSMHYFPFSAPTDKCTEHLCMDDTSQISCSKQVSGFVPTQDKTRNFPIGRKISNYLIYYRNRIFFNDRLQKQADCAHM